MPLELTSVAKMLDHARTLHCMLQHYCARRDMLRMDAGCMVLQVGVFTRLNGQELGIQLRARDTVGTAVRSVTARGQAALRYPWIVPGKSTHTRYLWWFGCRPYYKPHNNAKKIVLAEVNALAESQYSHNGLNSSLVLDTGVCLVLACRGRNDTAANQWCRCRHDETERRGAGRRHSAAHV